MNRNERKQFLRKIIDGLAQASNDVFAFSGENNYMVRPEYIVTVNVAQKIGELNKFWGKPYQIVLEENTNNFARACIPILSGPKDLLKTIISRRHNTTRNGRVDIAVYNEQYAVRQSYVAIEIKGFNPKARSLLKDIRRNLEYFAIKDETGPNHFALAVIAYLVLDTHAVFIGEESTGRQRAYNYAAKVLRTIDAHGLRVGIAVVTILLDLVNRKDYERDPHSDYWDHAIEKRCHTIAVLIYLYK